MIARARRAFPGMVVSMLLAAPALAAPSGVHKSPDHIAPRVAHPSSEQRKTAQRAGRTGAKATRIARAHPPLHITHFRSAHIQQAMLRENTDHSVSDMYDDLYNSPHYNNPHIVPAIATTGISTSSWQQTGMASWYGGARWHGHATSSGARYDQNDLTAAHATLPMGTRVRVTLAGSTRSVIVTINDRPGTRRRIIDLSRGAAAELGMLNSGVAMVTLSPL